MKAIKKPIPIEVKVFFPDEEIPGVQLMYGHDGHSVWNQLHNSFIGVKPGDMLNVTNLNDVYPIDATYFRENYDLV